MSASPAEQARRPWDLRLVQWLSRNSAKAPDKRVSNLYILALHTVLIVAAAVVTGATFWLVLAIITTATVGVRTYTWARSKRAHVERRPDTTTNPFGH